MTKTKKVGSTGRFGARYGRKLKLRVKQLEMTSKASYECPNCHNQKVKRVSAGIWRCQKCVHTFAGAAYHPGSGEVIKPLAVETVKEYEIEHPPKLAIEEVE